MASDNELRIYLQLPHYGYPVQLLHLLVVLMVTALFISSLESALLPVDWQVRSQRGCNITCACSHGGVLGDACEVIHATSLGNCLAHIQGPQDVPSRRRLAIQGKTYTKEEHEQLDKQIIKDINFDYDHYHKPRDLMKQHLDPKFAWHCESDGRPWQLIDGKPRIGLFFVLNRPQNAEKRAGLREMFRNFEGFPHKVSFAMGFPKESEFHNPATVMDVHRRVCQEQVAHGDLVLVNIRDNHNDGKTYYVFQEILVNITARSRYRYVIKLDDDSIVNIPAFHHWVQSKAEFTAQNVMFGARNGYGYLGALEGISTDLMAKVIPVVPDFYRGMFHEDLLISAWFRLWGENIVDVYFSGVEYYDVDFTNMTTNINLILNNPTEVVVIHRRKDFSEFLTLFHVMVTEYNSAVA